MFLVWRDQACSPGRYVPLVLTPQTSSVLSIPVPQTVNTQVQLLDHDYVFSENKKLSIGLVLIASDINCV